MASQDENIKEPDFWQKAWAESKQSPAQAKRIVRSPQEQVEFWNSFASGFIAHAAPAMEQRLNNVITALEQEKMLSPDIEILDVGCGPGTYALPFARRVKAVTALDGAREMCRMLEQKAEKEKLTNITVLERLWEDVDLVGESLANRFDLVFVSMTPAVNDYKTLLKLNQTSRQHCCLVSRVGNYDPVRRELWQVVFKQDEPKPDRDLVYIFNFLFARGYYPTMHYFSIEQTEEQTVNNALKSLCQGLWHYMEITPEVKENILAFVQQRSVNGIFRSTIRTYFNIMTWNINSRFC
ncbi:MAG TPA: class I SAM-dependent methyltransferase [Firmicutes bacterium]|nr:class I SAM-dependent methyltransferase [Bacillota bacterium]